MTSAMTSKGPAYIALRTAFNALYLEIPSEIVDDVLKRAEAALEEAFLEGVASVKISSDG